MSQELKEKNAATYIELSKDMNDKYTKYIKMFEKYRFLQKLNEIPIGVNDKVNDLKIDYDESREKFEKFANATPPESMDVDAIGAISYDGGSIHHSRRYRRRRITKKKSRKMRRTRRKHCRRHSSGRR